MARDNALTAAGGFLLALALIAALWPSSASAAPEDRDAICAGYRGTALWGECTRAVDNGCDETESAHPRCEQWAQMWRDQTGLEAPWLLICGDGFGSKCVFVTSTTHTGDLGGLAGADLICQGLADSGGSLAAPGTYKAWLSDAESSPADGRFTQSPVPYSLVDGTEIAANWADLIDSVLAAPIDLDERARQLAEPEFEFVWTNTTPGGATNRTLNTLTCDNWSRVLGGSDAGLGGDPSKATAQWTQWSINTCDEASRLYCFQQ